MVVQAPSNLKLRVWSAEGKAIVRDWNAAVEIRSTSGAISANEVRGSSLTAMCPSCNVEIKRAKGAVRCMGGSGTLSLSDVEGSSFYVETVSGAIDVSRIKADQLYVSRTGKLKGNELSGRIEFHAGDGSIEIQSSSGFLSGKTEGGSIRAEFRKWDFMDKGLIESIRGSIYLLLPPSFTGDLEAWSATGSTKVGFTVRPYLTGEKALRSGPEPINHVLGSIGRGGEILKVFSSSGDVEIKPIL